MDDHYDPDSYMLDPKFGDFGDLKELSKKLEDNDIALMIDWNFAFNSQSEIMKAAIDKNHPLNKEHSSEKYGDWPFKDFFIFADPKGYDENGKPIEPTQWGNLINDPEAGRAQNAWHWCEEREQFVLGMFMEEQRNLNMRSEFVQEFVFNSIEKYIDAGVVGFRIDAPSWLFLPDVNEFDKYPDYYINN